jgi:hypothetical protein
MPDASSAGDNARHEARVAGEVLRAWEAVHFADLKPDQRREDLADAGRGLRGSGRSA